MGSELQEPANAVEPDMATKHNREGKVTRRLVLTAHRAGNESRIKGFKTQLKRQTSSFFSFFLTFITLLSLPISSALNIAHEALVQNT